MSHNHYQRDLRELCEELGWDMEYLTNGHFKLTKPGCKTVFAASTPTNAWRTLLNTRGKMRRNSK